MSAVTYLEAISQAIREEMRRDEAVFLLGEDVGTYGGAFKVSAGFLEEFGPDRVIDTPMAEAAIIGSAVGAALMTVYRMLASVATRPPALPAEPIGWLLKFRIAPMKNASTA